MVQLDQSGKQLKIAIVHDHITQFGGAERVLYALHNVFPNAPIYTLFYDKELVDKYFPESDIRTSFLQKLPLTIRKRFRYIALLAIPAVENFYLDGYDIVISSSAFFAKGIVTGAETVHISYCHTPTKYLWELRPEKREKRGIRTIIENSIAHIFRLWDFYSAARVDHFIANSKNTKKRIRKYYRQDSFVVYPSVDKKMLNNGNNSDPMTRQRISEKLPDNFFLIVSQLQKYKNVDIAIEAFNRLQYPLVIVGDGPERKKLEKMAGDNIIFLGKQSDDIVKMCYEKCYAYIYAGKEDFGISAVEAMLFGKPVLAYKEGGVLESVVEGVSGEFFTEAHPAVLADGVRRLVENSERYEPAMIQQIGQKFDGDRFKSELRRVLKRILSYEWHKTG